MGCVLCIALRTLLDSICIACSSPSGPVSARVELLVLLPEPLLILSTCRPSRLASQAWRSLETAILSKFKLAVMLATIYACRCSTNGQQAQPSGTAHAHL